MTLQKYNIKVKENKHKEGLETARFALAYKKPGGKDGSYDIISALKGDSDVIVEVDSSLISPPSLDIQGYIKELVLCITNLRLDYIRRKVPTLKRGGLLSIFTGPKKTQADEIFIYIPASSWKKEGFRSLFPILAARYYVIKSNADLEKQDNMVKYLEKIRDMGDEERLDSFSLIAFDPGDMPMMGINSKTLDLEEIKERLLCQ